MYMKFIYIYMNFMEITNQKLIIDTHTHTHTHIHTHKYPMSYSKASGLAQG